MHEAPIMHWRASVSGDAKAERDVHDDDSICDHPQSGERMLGWNTDRLTPHRGEAEVGTPVIV